MLNAKDRIIRKIVEKSDIGGSAELILKKVPIPAKCFCLRSRNPFATASNNRVVITGKAGNQKRRYKS